jgi:hypothetical protein
MAPVKHQISEHDIVTLRGPVDKWPAGTRGTTMSDCYSGMFLVEIDNPDGDPLDNIIEVPADQLVLQQRWPSSPSETSQN